MMVKKPHYLNLLVHKQQLATNHVKSEYFSEILPKNTDKTIGYSSLQRESVGSHLIQTKLKFEHI